MNDMQFIKRSVGVTVVLGSLLLTACGGGGIKPAAVSADVTTVVPTEVSTASPAATAYVSALAATSSTQTDTLEPVAVPTALATDDTAEPV